MRLQCILSGLIATTAIGCTTTRPLADRVQRPPAFVELVGAYSSHVAGKPESDLPSTPMTIAVAQVGKSRPPEIVLDTLGTCSDIVGEIVPLPFTINYDPRLKYRSAAASPVNWQAPFNQATKALLAEARRRGLDYVLMISDRVDSETTLAATEALDILIVPVFALPSRKVCVSVSTSGALLDARTGDVIFVVGDSSKSSGLAASAGEDAKLASLASRGRSRTVRQISHQMVASLRQWAGAEWH